uniref:Uncharacterized protein n=1 Tax=Brassica campestris TaxID=3711 RepID=A0A3P6DVM1_BRACM|nr:unnamed protein product [Brassica rapa]
MIQQESHKVTLALWMDGRYQKTIGSGEFNNRRLAAFQPSSLPSPFRT